MTRVLRPGREYPLGATPDRDGVNFAVFSENATKVELCLFDDAHGVEERIPMRAGTAHVWHLYVAGATPGQRYGFRAHGPYDVARGHRFNPNKVLVDPYARALAGKVDYHAPVFGYAPTLPGEKTNDKRADVRDDSWGVPRSVVVDGAFDWGDDRAPEVPWPETVVYELHVKGFTRRHHDVPSEHRGTYLGVSSDATVAHLQSIGVTTVELMPVHEVCDELFVAKKGLTNYWGYSTLGFFAPDQRFAAHPPDSVREFKEMVKRLHAANIEVVLDVVYNHTCEGDRFGPTLSLRGLDNAVYYRLDPADLGRYIDYSGCGNTLNIAHPQTLKLIMDSLRYWVLDMHVDGFRFDLAPTLARDAEHMDKLSAFFDIIHQDPVLSRVKLIAEPWDLGAQGYQVGNFPVLWSEWNGRYRDTARRFWLGDRSKVGDLGYRLTGSSDLYGDDGRRPHASINFITAHDGFTLADLVSYEKKHNEANLQNNEDGWDDNASMNFGVEGETTDPAILRARAQQERNLLATLFLSQGVPMICAGDEIARTQRGNNNAYAQDNPTSWVDWEIGAAGKELLEFTRHLASVRRAHPSFRRRAFLRGVPVGKSTRKDAVWFRPLRPDEAANSPAVPTLPAPDGREATDLPLPSERGGPKSKPLAPPAPRLERFEMTGSDWEAPTYAAVGLLLAGDGIGPEGDDAGPGVVDETFLLLLNAEAVAVRFRIPATGAKAGPGVWRYVVDTVEQRGLHAASVLLEGAVLELPPRSLVVLGTEL